MRINQITPNEIGRLDPLQLVRLLHLLLHAEARKRGVCRPGIHVPFSIVVGDGGEDGRWDAELTTSDYIPNRFTIYQSKAEDILPGKCSAEILRERANAADPYLLKPKVEEVLQRNGCYCFFCKSDYAKEQIDRRVEKVREALTLGGRTNPERDGITFLDGNKIAEWVNLHVAAISFVRECCNLARTDGFLSWESWRKQRRDLEFPFETNAFLTSQITGLRDALLKPKTVARIIGQSGLGKTRLAFEIFRPIAHQGGGPANTILTHSMVYLDRELQPNNQFMDIIRQLAEEGVSGIVVIDNCGRTEHDQLARLVAIEGSNLALLTLDYELERIESSFYHVSLEPEQLEDIMPQLLNHIDSAKRLTEAQKQHIARYCQGFPQIAVLLAESEMPVVFERLTQGEFAKKLLWGRAAPDDDALRVVKSLSLFRHVGAQGGVENQISFVSGVFCPGFDERTFRDKCRPFQRRRVIQSAGDYWFVSPKPLAVALAAEWWESATTEELLRVLPEIESNGLVDAFCSQLRLLDASENARRIVQDLCAANGPFGSAEVIFSRVGSKLLRSIVELNPPVVLDALRRAFSERTLEELAGFTEARRNLVWTVEKLCWEASLFPLAAPLLLRLAASENETCGNNATGQFLQLYQIFLSGTRCPAIARLDVIGTGLAASQTEQRVCVHALGTAVKSATAPYSRMGGVETRGSQLPQSDWAPSTFQELADYQLRAFALLRDLVLANSPLSGLAAAELGEHIRTFLTSNYLDKVGNDILALARHLKGYWPKARRSIGDMLQYGQLQPGLTIDARVHVILAALEPSDIRLKGKQLVTEAGYRVTAAINNVYVDEAALNAEAFGKEIAADHPHLAEILPDLMSGKQEQGISFGIGLGAGHPRPTELIELCLQILRQTENPNPSVLGGVLRALGEQPIVRDTLDLVAKDAKLWAIFPKLVTVKQLTRDDLIQFVTLIREKKIPSTDLWVLCYGSVTDSLSPEDLESTIYPLAMEAAEAVVPVYQVYGMYMFRNRVRWERCRTVVRNLILQEGFLEQLAGSRDEYLWSEHCKELLTAPDGEVFAENQIRQIVIGYLKGAFRDPSANEIHHVTSAILGLHSTTCWPVIGAALVGDEKFMIEDLLKPKRVFGQSGRGQEQSEVFSCVLWAVPTDFLIEWCGQNLIAVDRLFGVAGLFETQQDGSFSWHPTIIALLDHFYREEKLGEIAGNLLSFSSCGSRVPYIQRRIDLLKQLRGSHSAAVRGLADELIPLFEQQRGAEQKQDDQFRAGIF